jgi:hypothetical protein
MTSIRSRKGIEHLTMDHGWDVAWNMDIEYFWILSRNFLSLPKYHPQEDLISGGVEVKQSCQRLHGPLSVGCTYYPNRWRIRFIISEKIHSSCVNPAAVQAKCWLDTHTKKKEKAIRSNFLWQCNHDRNELLELFQIHFRILAGLLTKRSGGPSPEAWFSCKPEAWAGTVYMPLLGLHGDLILL